MRQIKPQAHPAGLFLDVAVGVELVDIGPEVVDPFWFLMPANIILVPGIMALGILMYCLNVVSFQTMPEFLLASE